MIFNMMYIDPSSVTFLASAITSIAVAIGASAIIIWRNVKKKVKKTLHIDENAGKEVEEEIVLTKDETVTEEKSASEKSE